MRTTMLLVIAFAGAGSVSADPMAPKVESKAAQCRADAATLREKADLCRAAIADGKTCNGVKVRGNPIAPDDAQRMAAEFDANAKQLDAAVPRIRKLDDLVANAQNGIRDIGFATTVEQLKAWDDMGKARQCELVKTVIDIALTEVVGKASADLKSITPGQARDMLARWRKVVKKVPLLKRAVMDSGLFDLLAKIAKHGADDSTVELAAVAVTSLKTLALEGYACSETKPGWKDTEAWVNQTAEVFGSVVPDARVRFGFLGVKSANNLVHALGEGVLIASETERLTQLTADQHRTLARLTELLRKHVAERKTLVGRIKPCTPP